MLLYHGSNVPVKAPRLLKNQRDLDFGRGFYTTSDLDQAMKWAKRTSLRLRQQESFVSVYTIDEASLTKLRFLSFARPDAAWLRFVAENRKGRPMPQAWDIIAGPVADDQTAPVIDLFLDGMYDEQEAIRRLLPQKLKDQYTFKTDEALALLHYREVICL